MIVATATDVRYAPGRSDRLALAGVSLELAEGEVLLVEGPSGGGKSTLLRALSGLVPHFHGGRFAGRVTVLGHDTRTTDASRLARHVGSVFQDPESQAVRAVVARDVAFGPENAGVAPHLIAARVDEALELAAAAHLRNREITTLSGGERQRVALAGALALRPRILLLDEPTSQLDKQGTAALCAALADLSSRGAAIVIAEHRTGLVGHLADRTIALRAGRIEPPGPPEPAEPPGGSPQGDAILTLTGVTAGYGGAPVLRDCDLDLHAGAVTALHGSNGSGKSTLARVIAGLLRPAQGTTVLHGHDIADLPPERRHPRIGVLTQDAGRWLLRERVDDEIAFGLGHLDVAARRRRVRDTLANLDLTAHAHRHPLDLSVGERERVALAAVLAPHPDVIVLDEPSRGMDPQRKAALATTLRAHADRGAAILLATHDAPFAKLAADRHVRLADGRVAEPSRVAA